MYEKTYQEIMNEVRDGDQVEQNTFDSIVNVAKIISDIVKYRIEQGLTQKEIADMTGMKQSAIARLENLDSMPRIDTVVKVALALGMVIQATVPNMPEESIVLKRKLFVRDQVVCQILTLGA